MGIEGTWEDKQTQVIISLYLEEDAEICLDFSYSVKGGTWTPSYDIHIEPNSNDITLKYYGIIEQPKLEKWKEIQLSLSTGKSSLLHDSPELPISTLSLAPKGKGSGVRQGAETLTRQTSEEISQPQGNVLFVINERVSLDENRSVHRVPITEFTLTASFRHIALPKLQ